MQASSNPLPAKFIERIKLLTGEKRAEEIVLTLGRQPLPSIRINTIKNGLHKGEQVLGTQENILEKVPWYSDAYTVPTKTIRELTETAAYKDGLFYIQNLSSMLPALILSPTKTEKVLDMAAAPGSKTTQIATLMQNKGEVIANDLSRKRLYKLKENLTTYGVTNTTITNIPGQFIWKKYPEYFDKVLVDAPCSMEGRINTLDPKSYQDWSPKKIKELATRQKFLLRSAVLATKPGGTIVYATCTLSPEENESVVDWVLKKEQGHIEIAPIAIPNLTLSEGLTQWQKKKFDPTMQHTARVYPSTSMEGFFVAKIKKLSSSFIQ